MTQPPCPTCKGSGLVASDQGQTPWPIIEAARDQGFDMEIQNAIILPLPCPTCCDTQGEKLHVSRMRGIMRMLPELEPRRLELLHLLVLEIWSTQNSSDYARGLRDGKAAAVLAMQMATEGA